MVTSMDGPEPGGGAAKDGRCLGDSPDSLSTAAGCYDLRRQIREVLEEHRIAGELLLRQHQAALRDALERVCFATEPIHTAPPTDGLLGYQTSSNARPAAASGLPGSAPSTQEAGCFTGSRQETQEVQSAIPGSLRWLHRHASPSPANNKFISKLIDSRQDQNAKATRLRQRLETMTEHPAFDSFIGCFIVLNTVVMFVQLEAEAPSQDGGRFMRPSSHMAFGVLAHIFNAIFFVEIVIRLYVKRCRFFRKAFNWIEMLIVALTLIDAYVLPMVQGDGGQNISFMYVVRFIRVVRALRVIRTLSLFRSLRVLVNTIALSLQSLFWSMLILFLFMLIFSLFMCQILSAFILDESNADHEMKQWAFRYYGSSFRALWTVFEVTFSGGWPNYARPLVENVDAYYAVFFAAYIMGVVVATVRIVFALFLKDTLQSASSDAEMVVAEKMSEMKAVTVKLSEMFRMADESGDGYLSAEELHVIMERPEVSSYLGELDLETSDTELLFQVLDEGDGLVPYNRFVNGLLRLKGFSHAQETIHIMRDCEKICKHCEATRAACEELLTGLNVPRRQGGQEPSRHQRRIPSATERRTDAVLASTTSSIQMA